MRMGAAVARFLLPPRGTQEGIFLHRCSGRKSPSFRRGHKGSMNDARESQLPVVPAWQLEFARLIAFPAEPPLFIDQHWWQDLVAEQPDDFVSTRKKHTHEDKGSFQGGILTLTVDLSRVIWLVQPSGEADEAGNLPTVGPFRGTSEWFVKLLSPWLAHRCPPIGRLAFTGKLLQTAANHQEVYRTLAGHLHLPHEIFDPNPPNDFFLQINRRRRSTVVTGLEINRVSAWSKLNVIVSVEPTSRGPFTWPDKCYCAVELDINTAPERTEALPHELLPRLFQELVSLAVEIAERGDVR